MVKNVFDEQGNTITVACPMSVAGHYVPLFFIFARKIHNPLLLKDRSSGSVMIVTDLDYMNTETLLVYLDHFRIHTNQFANSLVLLIWDNHISQVSLQAISSAKRNNTVHIWLISLSQQSSNPTL